MGSSLNILLEFQMISIESLESILPFPLRSNPQGSIVPQVKIRHILNFGLLCTRLSPPTLGCQQPFQGCARRKTGEGSRVPFSAQVS